MSKGTHSIGIDIGGTFTDFVSINEKSGDIQAWKSLSTPRDPSAGFFSGLDDFMDELGIRLNEVQRIVHGTTVASNSVIERKGAKTAFLATKGFSDIIHMCREDRYDMYDLQIKFSETLVPRFLCAEIDERTDFRGYVLKKASEEDIKRIIDSLVEQHDIESLAVCFLHSYANPQNERMVEAIAKQYPNLSVSISSSVLPSIREYERAITTIVDAFIKPVVTNYLARLEEGLSQRGFAGQLYIMTCSGGLLKPDVSMAFPVRLLESGPAAGVIISREIGRLGRSGNVLAFDMGGTTSKGCFVVNGKIEKVEEFEVARIHRMERGSGIPIRSPSLNLIEIGGGGGSIVRIDDRNVIQVGPQSAGADPGPACYGLGGDQPTITDADLVLGYLNPGYFLGGKMKLLPEKARDAFETKICKSLGISLFEAAWAAHEIVNENIATAFRLHASERGIDYRDYLLVSSGGCGPIHAYQVARKLGIRRAVFPLRSGVLSALGLLFAPLSFEFVRTRISLIEELTAASYQEIFQLMYDEGAGILREANVQTGETNSWRRIDARYSGQGWEVELDLGPLLDKINGLEEYGKLRSLFEDTYYRLYANRFSDTPVELVTYKLTVSGPDPKIELRGVKGYERESVKEERLVYFPDLKDSIPTPVYDRYSLTPGTKLEGPAVIEERESTSVIGPQASARIDDSCNIVVEVAQ